MRPHPPPNLADLTDRHLADLFRKDVPGAQEELHRRHKETFRRQAEGLTRRSNTHTVDDLLHEHFVHLHEKHGQYNPALAPDPENPWQPWASKLLFNLGHSLWRHGRVQRPVDPSQPDVMGWVQRETTGHEDLTGYSREPNPLESASLRELKDDIADCLKRLPSVERKVLVRCLAGDSNNDIARALGFSAATASKRHASAEEHLRACLRQKGYGR